MKQATTSLNRTQVGLIIFLISTLVPFIISLILNLFDTSGAGMVANGQVSPGFASSSCTSVGSIFLSLIGMIILYSDAHHYHGKYRTIYGIALALYIGAILSIIVSLVGRTPYTQTGNINDYRHMLHCISIGTGLFALVPSVIAWHLFKPGWHQLPIIIGVYRAVINVGAIQNALWYTTLVARPLMDQTLYVPRFTENGLTVHFTIAGLIGDLLLCGMWALLLFAPAYVMPPRVDAQETDSQTS